MGSQSLIVIFCFQILCMGALAQDLGFGGETSDEALGRSKGKWGFSYFSLSSVLLKQVQEKPGRGWIMQRFNGIGRQSVHWVIAGRWI